MHKRRILLLTMLVLASARVTTLHGANKNGVSPQVISLPSGPGSIQGLGESFQPQLNTGAKRTFEAVSEPVRATPNQPSSVPKKG